MKNYDLYVGIDVSSETIDVVTSIGEYQKLRNDKQGFKELEELLLPNSLVVMEATGVYHQSIAYYLHNHGDQVSVMQSGRVKRYAQSLDQRSKTDALDSKMLSMLGLERKLRLWEPPSTDLL